MKTVNLFSGGLDSFIASKLYDVDVNLHIDVGERYSAKQRALLNTLKPKNLAYLGGLNLQHFVGLDGVYLPHRNMLFITLAAMYGDEIILSSTDGDAFPDKSRYFMDRMEEALDESIGASHYRVKSPFAEMTKPEVVGAYKEAGHDMGMLNLTSSCYDPNAHECSECSSCLRRRMAFAINGYRVDEIKGITHTVLRRLKGLTYSDSERENRQVHAFLMEQELASNDKALSMTGMFRFI